MSKFNKTKDTLSKCISYIHDKALKEKWDPLLINSLISLLKDFCTFGGMSTHFQSEFCSEESFAERLWEMQMAEMLKNEGLQFQVCGEGKPDFYLPAHNLWIEATCPKPSNIPKEFLILPERDRTELTTFRVPTDEILLRWTTAIDAKKKQAVSYRNKRIIKENDAFIIAVSGCQLGYIRHFNLQGISDYPYPVEIGYGIGERALIFNDNPEKDQFISLNRSKIKNQNGSPVSTALFYLDEYKIISAIVGSNIGLNEILLEKKEFVIAHNQNAKNPVSQGVFKMMKEYGANKI